jgi:hypothetical protein
VAQPERVRSLLAQLGTIVLWCCCAGPVPPVPPASLQSTSGPSALGQPQLCDLSIVFEPALPRTGKLVVAHESGWTIELEVAPSGVDLRLPEGPCNLTLLVGAQSYERTCKASLAASGSLRWQLRP